MLLTLPVNAMRHATCAVALMACAGMLFAQDGAREAVPFAKAPESLRAFFVKAKQADAIADPLERCLALPDVPGNRWPVGLVKAHCEYAHGPYLTPAQLSALVERKAFAELDARFRADLDKHYLKEGFSEAIHRDFQVFDGGAESDRLSKLWLESAPQSAFALAARGEHYLRAAWNARGSQWASETDDWKLARMGMLASMATDLLQKSLEREPKLIHSYANLIDVARMHGADEMNLKAFTAGSRLDPLCRSLGIMRMASLRPRWGGSYEAMAAYSSQLAPFERDRPLVANVRAEYAAEQAWALARERKHKEIFGLLTPFAAESTAATIHRQLGWAMAYGQIDPWTELVYMLQAVRFNDDASDYGEIGRILEDMGESEWASRMFEREVRFDPQNPEARIRLARSLFWLKRFEQAEPAYRATMNMPEHRRESLNALAAMQFQMGRYDKVLADASVLTKNSRPSPGVGCTRHRRCSGSATGSAPSRRFGSS